MFVSRFLHGFKFLNFDCRNPTPVLAVDLCRFRAFWSRRRERRSTWSILRDGPYLDVPALLWLTACEKVVKTCAPGGVFGELVFLCNCPRAASVDSKSDCTVWRLDIETLFTMWQKMLHCRNMWSTMFFCKSKVSLFSSLNDHQRSQIADSLKTEKVHQDQDIPRRYYSNIL